VDASPDSTAPTANGALAKAASKRVRIAPVARGAADDEDTAESLLAELQAEMLSLE